MLWRMESVSQGSVEGPARKRQFRPTISASEYPVRAQKASLTATIGLSGRRGLLMTEAIGLSRMPRVSVLVERRRAEVRGAARNPVGLDQRVCAPGARRLRRNILGVGQAPLRDGE